MTVGLRYLKLCNLIFRLVYLRVLKSWLMETFLSIPAYFDFAISVVFGRHPKAYEQCRGRLFQVRLLHHSHSFLIVDKPSGLTITTRRLPNADFDAQEQPEQLTVEYILQQRYPQYHLRNVHQIDSGTSGIYCIALTQSAASAASQMFNLRLVQKTYVAMVEGNVDLNKLAQTFDQCSLVDGSDKWHLAQTDLCLQVDIKIGQCPKSSRSSASEFVDGCLYPKLCTTFVKVIKVGMFEGQIVTLVELQPKTGRMHQLRVHLSALGHPIVGDVRYLSSIKADRLMLHAYAIKFRFADFCRLSMHRRSNAKLLKKLKKKFNILSWLTMLLQDKVRTLDSVPARKDDLFLKTIDVPFLSLLELKAA